MALAFTAVTTFTDDTPAANSQATGSISRGPNRLYLVTVCSHLGGSTNPPSATLSGWGVTWTEGLNNIWRGSGTNRGRTQMFWAEVLDTASAALTVTYTGVTLLSVDVAVDYVTGYDPADPVVETNDQESGTSSHTGGNTTSFFTMNALASVDNRTWASMSINGNDATMAWEANYTGLSSVGSSTAPTRKTITGWRNSATPDLTPAFTATSNWTAGGMAVEVKCAPSTSIKSIHGVARANIKSVHGVAVANVKSVHRVQ